MDFQVSDFSLMDYDTYQQIIDGSFLDYMEWINSISPLQLEDLSLQKIEEKEMSSDITEIGNLKNRDSFLLEILLFLLEFSCDHYGTFLPSPTYQSMETKEKIQELFSFYSSVGMDQEDTIQVVKAYFKSLGKVQR